MMKTYTSRAVRGFILIFLVNIMSAFLAYLLRVVMARNLTTEEYGLFFSVLVLINFLTLFKYFGLDRALVKYIPEFQVKKKTPQIKTVLSTVLLTKSVLALIISIALFFLSPFLAEHYFKTPLADIILKVFAVIFMISVTRDFFRSVFQGYQKMTAFSMNYFSENLIILIFVLGSFYYGLGLMAVVFAHLLVHLVNFFIFLPFFNKFTKTSFFSTDYSYPIFKKLIKFGLPSMVGGLGNMIVVYTDTLILTCFRSLSEVGIYNAVVPTAMLLNFLALSLVQAIFPLMSELWAKRKRKFIKAGIRLIDKYLFVIAFPLTLIIFSFPQIIIKLLFGQEYVAGSTTLSVLVFAVLFLIIGATNLNIVSALGKPKMATKIMMIAALFNFVTNLAFIPLFGMLGAAVTSLFSYFIVFIISSIRLSKLVGLFIPWKQWIKITLISAVFLLFVHIGKVVLETNVYLEIVLAVGIAGLIYLALMFVFKILDIKEIRDLLDSLNVNYKYLNMNLFKNRK